VTTAFFRDERCFWHGGGNYAFTVPAGGLVQPLPGGLPENPETKRRLLNLLLATGLIDELDVASAPPADMEELARVHSRTYLEEFRRLSDSGGGELGPRAPFGPGGYEIAALSAGLARQALRAVLRGEATNAYALSRPPGHHCLPDLPNGFCLLANIAIAVEAARAERLCQRVAILDWDVHHGNGTEAIFLDDPDVLTISLHQHNNYPPDSGHPDIRGAADSNMNIPLPPGTGHAGYLEAMERLVVPTIRAFAPEVIVVACGYDAAAIDPLGRMLATAETFARMTGAVMELAGEMCSGRLVLVHEGGYSELYVPFCGHAVLQRLSGSRIEAPDPLGETLAARQPDAAFRNFVSDHIGKLAALLLPG